MNDKSLIEIIEMVRNYVSAGTISQMSIESSDSLEIKHDGSKVYFDITQKKEHFPIKLNNGTEVHK